MKDNANTASFLRTVLDANPSVVLVVDKNIQIFESNKAAAQLVGRSSTLRLTKGPGDGLSCLNSTTAPGGCGHARACATCVIRSSVNQALAGHEIHRVRTKMTLVTDDGNREYFFLITASPLDYEGESLVHLVLEDITEYMEMREIIPICVRCKKIRQDGDYWDAVEKFMIKYLDLSFTHGYCPECAEEVMKEIEALPDNKQESAE